MQSERLKTLFADGEKFLSVFVTAGYPNLSDTVAICEALAESGVRMIELGIPFSDSIADGPTIQAANEKALENGVTVLRVLEMLREMRTKIKIPVVLMGSFNPVLQYGVEKFCREANNAGADGVIIPDLPLESYLSEKDVFEDHGLANIFLITSNTPDERIKKIDEASTGFIYAVSMAGVTGKGLQIDDERRAYLERLRSLDLKSPLVVGFGIEMREQFLEVTKYASGAIVGSAFIKAIENADDVRTAAREFVKRFIYTGE
jgi:tryptophan synthase alpha chain